MKANVSLFLNFLFGIRFMDRKSRLFNDKSIAMIIKFETLFQYVFSLTNTQNKYQIVMGKSIFGHMIQFVNFISSYFNVFLKYIFGPTLAIVCNVLVCYVIYIYLYVLFPRVVLISNTSIISYYVHILLSVYFSVNILLNSVSCTWTSPGSPEKCLNHELEFWNQEKWVNAKKYTNKNFNYTISRGIAFRYCRKCDCVKFPRTHHCNVNNMCVYNMDHYCPWMSNTIGLYNYKYFYLFLLHLTTGCIYVFYMLFVLNHSLTIPER